MISLNLVYQDVSKLTPYPTNARTHSKKQIRQIARSIEKYGFLNPILIDADGFVIAGHGRLEAAMLLGMTEAPTISIAHMTPEEVRAYRIADNKLAELAGWDPEILKIEFQNLIEIDSSFDLTVTGFETAEIDILLQDDENKKDRDDDTDGLLESKAISQPGDLWNLGAHKILCGNALKIKDYATLMGNQKAQLCFADPPYNVKINGHVCGQGVVKHAEFAMASGEMSREEFIDFLKVSCANLADYSQDGAISFICMDWRHIEELITASRGIFDELKNICVWAKDNGGMGSLYRSQHEFVAVFKRGTAPHINNIELGKHGRYRTNIWNYAGQNTFHAERASELASHPTVKPVQLVADAILDCSMRDGIILDPFGGSGTTLLAAERTARRARLLELEPLYVDLTIRRWQQQTGQVAVHALTGKAFTDVAGENSHD